ncbi:MAG: 3-phosphoshikimate 1-carboxyvinyltransferase [Clostridiaceae bacterium]|nr:3-phosphoshikimate 1-carboxyvinyltransferase [Clostridiaceae bacterium]
MLLKVGKSNAIKGARARIPGSKSHTIRALFISSLAWGESRILQPLVSDDTLSAVKICESFGAGIIAEGEGYAVKGFGQNPQVPEDVVHVGNSGTSLRLGLSVAALAEGYTVFTGDEHIRRRPLGPLVDALNDLGATAFTTRGNGMAPVVIKGRMKGGKTRINAYTSQFLSSLLISCPLLENDTEIDVITLNEVPYVEMTLWWLDKQGIKYENEDFKKIYIYGGQEYKEFDMYIPGDFSSATFFIALAAISGDEIVLENLDINDPQGDKMVLSILESMGAKVEYRESCIVVKGDRLTGMEIDMNYIPDALPAMAVVGCFAEGETRLVNVPQARIKETDRISVMCHELRKMGASVSELPDGLIIRKSRLKGCEVDGHHDHRVVMALTVAGLNAEGDTLVKTAEAINVTFPDFAYLVKRCGYDINVL